MNRFSPNLGSVAPTYESSNGILHSDWTDSCGDPSTATSVGLDFNVFIDEISGPIYFSTVTFTTLGYGDLRPLGRLRVAAAVEAALGAIMMAMLTVVYARRFLRL